MPTTIITGGTGTIGKSLTNYLLDLGHSLIIFTRNPENKPEHKNITYKEWDPFKGIIDHESVSVADYVINLAGAGVMDKAWTENYKKFILESRTKSGFLLSETIAKVPNKIKAFISASAIGWYGEDKVNLLHSYGFIESDPPAKNFLGETCLLWEESVDDITKSNIRLVKLRFGIVLSKDGGAYPEFTKSIKFGVASILGNGKQIVSWIHVDDLCRMIGYCLEHKEIEGVYNAVAPEPVRNKELVIQIASTIKGKFFVPVHIARSILELIMGKRSIEILKSTKVSCKKIKSAGFTFLYPNIKLAVEQLEKN